jgi:hypothetical protein
VLVEQAEGRQNVVDCESAQSRQHPSICRVIAPSSGSNPPPIQPSDRGCHAHESALVRVTYTS